MECNYEVESCILRLRFLSKFYMNLIETRQNQMNHAHQRFLQNRDDLIAYDTWTCNKIKILDLYEYWLRELKVIHAVDDPVAICMQHLMLADCYSFLAKLDRPAFEINASNYDMACRSLIVILEVITPMLDQQNSFYQHIMNKLKTILKYYKESLGNGRASIFNSIPRVPMNMFEADWKRLPDYIDFYRKQTKIKKSSKDFSLYAPSHFSKKIHNAAMRMNKLFT